MQTSAWTRRQSQGLTTWEGTTSGGYRVLASVREQYAARNEQGRGRWWLDTRSQYVILAPKTNEIVYVGWHFGGIEELISRAEVNVQVYEGDIATVDIRRSEYEADEAAFRLAECAENTN